MKFVFWCGFVALVISLSIRCQVSVSPSVLTHLPSYVLALSAAAGAYAAWRGVDSWREEQKTNRRTDLVRRLFKTWTKLRHGFEEVNLRGAIDEHTYLKGTHDTKEYIFKEIIQPKLANLARELEQNYEKFDDILLEAKMLHGAKLTLNIIEDKRQIISTKHSADILLSAAEHDIIDNPDEPSELDYQKNFTSSVKVEFLSPDELLARINKMNEHFEGYIREGFPDLVAEAK